MEYLKAPTEEQEQITLFNWARMREQLYPELRLMFHIPNGGARSKSEAARFKAAGVKAGVPDIFLPAPSGKHSGLFIEMKRRKGGRISAEQEIYLKDLAQMGYAVCICYGWEDAADTIKTYLGER